MHELLAVCLLTVDRDSLSPSSPPETGVMAEAMESTLDRRYVEHDAFDLFMAIMKPAKAFYEWKQEEGPVSPPRHPGIWVWADESVGVK